jgi:hypothetical protein
MGASLSSASSSSMLLHFELVAPRRWRQGTFLIHVRNKSSVGVTYIERRAKLNYEE